MHSFEKKIQQNYLARLHTNIIFSILRVNVRIAQQAYHAHTQYHKLQGYYMYTTYNEDSTHVLSFLHKLGCIHHIS